MENPNNIKRSIRIPKKVYEELKKEAKFRNISINKTIIDMLERAYGVR